MIIVCEALLQLRRFEISGCSICTCRKSNGSSLDALTAAGPPTVQRMILEDLLKPDATIILGSVNMQLDQTCIYL